MRASFLLQALSVLTCWCLLLFSLIILPIPLTPHHCVLDRIELDMMRHTVDHYPPCPQPHKFYTPYALCSNSAHFMSEYPMAPEYPEFVQEQTNAAQGFARNDNDFYSTRYNSCWVHHPNLSWTQQAPANDSYSYSHDFESKVLQAFQRLEASTLLLNSHTHPNLSWTQQVLLMNHIPIVMILRIRYCKLFKGLRQVHYCSIPTLSP